MQSTFRLEDGAARDQRYVQGKDAVPLRTQGPVLRVRLASAVDEL